MIKYIFFCSLLLFFFIQKAFSVGSTFLEFNISDFYRDISLDDEKCSFLIDNPKNYKIVQESGNKFQISALKVDESSATLIIDCKNDSYIFNLKYTNMFPQNGLLMNDYIKGDSFFNYNFFASKDNLSQSFTYSDATRKDIYFSLNHADTDLRKKFFSNNMQLNYLGNPEKSGFFNNLNAGTAFSNGLDLTGRFYSYQFSGGLYQHTLSLQTLKYQNYQRPTRVYSLAIPSPLGIMANYRDNYDESKQYQAQRLFSVSYGSFQNNNIVQVIRNTSKTETGSEAINSFVVNSFSNYYFSPLVYEQISFYYACQNGSACQLSNLSTSFNFQNQNTRTQVGYSAIPQQLYGFLQNYFWGDSDIVINYTQTFNPIPFFQRSPITATTTEKGDPLLSSLLDLRYKTTNWLTTLTLPLLFLNQQTFSQLNIQYDSKQISAFTNITVSPQENNNDWRKISWNASLGVTYYPASGLQQALLLLKKHKITGRVISNTGLPIETAKISLKSGSQTIMTTVSDSTGAFLFDNVPTYGTFSVSAEKNGIEETQSFRKRLDDVTHDEQIELPVFTVVKVLFFVDTGDGKTDTWPGGLANSNGQGLALVSVKGGAYEENRIILPRGKTETFEITPAMLPFGYKVKSLSSKTIDTVKDDAMELKVVLERGL